MAHLTATAHRHDPLIARRLPRYRIAGSVRDVLDAPVAGRTVLALRADTLQIAARTVSLAGGSYQLETAHAGAHTLLFSGEPDANALVLAGVVPL